VSNARGQGKKNKIHGLGSQLTGHRRGGKKRRISNFADENAEDTLMTDADWLLVNRIGRGRGEGEASVRKEKPSDQGKSKALKSSGGGEK